jgi:epoxyqueuosine reductase
LISPHQRSVIVKKRSKELGFSYCGISKAEFLENEAKPLEDWLNKNLHGQMQYMANHFDKRLDPRLLVPGAKAVVSLLYNYFQPMSRQADIPKISMYASGTDYHLVIKDKLFQLLDVLRQDIGDIEGRVFVDSAPVLDRAWAKRSGLGWIGKNANLINKSDGSYFFIAELIIDLDLEVDGPVKDFCGTCTRCIDACPTDAIIKPYVVDGSKCISYLTIELKNQIPSEFKDQMDGWVFGCDICQEVCPWNRFSKPTNEELFQVDGNLSGMNKRDWVEMTEQTFGKIFNKSAVKRAGHPKLMDSIKFAGFTRDDEEKFIP